MVFISDLSSLSLSYSALLAEGLRPTAAQAPSESD